MKQRKLKEIALSIFTKMVSEEGIKDFVELKIIRRNIMSKKSAFVISDDNRAVVVLNLDKIDDDNLEKTKIKLHKTLQHEIEHIKMRYNREANNYSYNHLMGIMEYLYYSQIFDCKSKITPFYIMKNIIVRKQVKKNNDCSPLEITADLLSYSKTMDKFSDKLSEEELQQYKKIIESLTFLSRNFEIFYDINQESLNRFSLFASSAKSCIKKDSHVLEKYPILKNVFNDKFELKSVYDLYNEINYENENMYSRLILDYFMTFKADYTEYFKDEKFKNYVENLFNGYIEQAINYYNNISLGNIFVDNRKVLVDNLRMKKRNVLVLNSIAKVYGLEIIGKNILDSSRIYTYKKEQISTN